MAWALVGVGGAAGVLARYGIDRLGSFLLGLLVAGAWFSTDTREALGVGVLGGFTTLSTFSVQVVLEADGGRAAATPWAGR